jgi:hypothetical protein
MLMQVVDNEHMVAIVTMGLLDMGMISFKLGVIVRHNVRIGGRPQENGQSRSDTGDHRHHEEGDTLAHIGAKLPDQRIA